MRRHRLQEIVIIITITLAALCLAGCRQGQAPIDPTTKLLQEKTEALFTRLKVLDYDVLYECELPYLKEELSLEEYLKNRYIVGGRLDTLQAVEIDSSRIMQDSAYVYMKTEYVLADSSLNVDTIRFGWIRLGEDWCHPTLSNMERQKEFEEELRVYWEAVRKMQKQQEQTADSLPKDSSP
jgi:hypothetical protein